MRYLTLILLSCTGLSACASPALIAIPATMGVGLIINNENLDEPLSDPKEIAKEISTAIKEGYNQETNTTFNLNE